jgi:hypothetical protein
VAFKMGVGIDVHFSVIPNSRSLRVRDHYLRKDCDWEPAVIADGGSKALWL